MGCMIKKLEVQFFFLNKSVLFIFGTDYSHSVLAGTSDTNYFLGLCFLMLPLEVRIFRIAIHQIFLALRQLY